MVMSDLDLTSQGCLIFSKFVIISKPKLGSDMLINIPSKK